MAEPEGGGGGGFGAKVGPFPVWVWAVGLGGVVGLVWFLRRGSNSAAASTTSTGDPTEGNPDPTTIVPVNQGLSESQWQQLMAAIRGLYGQTSTPPPDTTPPDSKTGLPAPKTPAGSITIPSPPPPTTGGGNTGSTATVHPLFITVPQGSGWSWSSIAAQYGHSWQDLWNYNLTPGVRPADTQAKLRSEGASHSLFGGTKVAIPSNWKKK